MFKALFKKEIEENIHNLRFLLALIICLIVIPVGFYINQKGYFERRQVYDDAVNRSLETTKTVRDLMRDGGLAFRPPSPLSMLSVGIESALPTAVRAEGPITHMGARVGFNYSRSLDDPLADLYGRIDLAFILSTVIGALVMVFSFNAVSGEKGRGTLAQIMANQVPRSTVISAKAMAGSAMLIVAFLIGIILALLLLSASGLSPFKWPGSRAPFSIGIGVSILFLIASFNFGLLVSSVSKSQVSAMVWLLSLWIVFGTIIPRGSVLVAKLIIPVRSQEVIDLEITRIRFQSETGLYSALKKDAASHASTQSLSPREYQKRKKQADPAIIEYEREQSQIQDEFITRLNLELDKIEAEHERQRSSETALAENLSRLSPISCLNHLLAELAGTGFVEERAWRETSFHYKQLIDREVSSRSRLYSLGGTISNSGDPDRAAPAPRLPAERISLTTILKSVWLDVMLLAVYAVLFFAGAYVAFLRYDVR